MNKLCLYHRNCTDGMTAAWVVWRKYRDDVDMRSVNYGEDIPTDIDGRDVIIVDFSYKRPAMEEIARRAKTVVIIDHHKTAEAELAGYIEAHENVTGIFDMEKAGCLLTWEWYNPIDLPPAGLIYVNDRDLWRFEFGDRSKLFHAAISSYEYDFEEWDRIMTMPAENLMLDGEAIGRKLKKDIEGCIAAGKMTLELSGHAVPALNCPPQWASDAGHIMSQGEKFAVCFIIGKEKAIFSLRSADDGMDVSEIAAMYGGGGHKHAAGFSLPVSVALEKLLLHAYRKQL